MPNVTGGIEGRGPGLKKENVILVNYPFKKK
jgi:hypothetical protein